MVLLPSTPPQPRRHGMRRYGVRVLAALGLLSRSAVVGHAQVSVDPLVLVLRDTASQRIQLYNPDSTVAQIAITRGDWRRGRTGETVWADYATTPRSCGDALEVPVTTLTVLPRTSVALPVRVRDAARIARGCWAAVHIDMDIAAPPQTKGATIRYQLRTAVKIVAFPTNGLERLEMVGLSYVPAVVRGPFAAPATPADSLPQPGVRVSLRNTGAQQVQPVLRLEFRSSTTGVLMGEAVTVETVPMLPGALLDQDVALPALPAGSYVVVAILEWGGADVIVRRLGLTVQGR